MTPLLFRRLIVIWWVLVFVCAIVGVVTEGYLPPELRSYRESAAASEPTVFDWAALTLALVLTIALVVASIGLYNFKEWGRTLFLWTNIACLPLPIAFGVSIESGLASSVYYLDALLTGGILFAMYLPPIGTIIDQQSPVAEGDEH